MNQKHTNKQIKMFVLLANKALSEYMAAFEWSVNEERTPNILYLTK